MKEDKKTSVIKEALVEYKELQEAAVANAKDILAKQFPKSYSELLKEELNKNNKEKESYKKLDENKESDKDDIESKKESVMKNQTKETKKVVKEEADKSKPFDEKPKGLKNVEEDVKITDTVGDGDPFDEKAKGVKKIEEEREKDFMGDVESETPNQGKGEAEKGKVFNEKIKGPTSGKPISNLTEEFDITELDMQSVDNAIGGAGDEDEIITIDEIESEISQMEGLGEELNDMGGLPRPELQKRGTPENQGGDAFKQLVNMKSQIDEILQGMSGLPRPEVGQVTGQMKETELQPDEMSPQEFSAVGGIAEAEDMITDDDIDAVLGAPEGEVDEAHGVSFSSGTITPGKLGDNEGSRGRFRKGVDESKKVGSLIDENKKLTKKLNEDKKFKVAATKLVENYKSALEKYRNQLKEMAVFNTNLAHVNNLMVNEGLALTQDDKIRIINEFKTVDSITESQKKYKAFLSEMKDSKKTLTESIEGKVSASIQPSSKQKLDEVVEKTAYENNDHLNRMKKIIETIEHRGKKII